MVAGGVAALVLIGLLIYAVLQVSDDSTTPPAVVFPSTSAATKTSGLKTPSSTSYTTPRVQTSEPTSTSTQAPDQSSTEQGEPSDSDESATTTSTTTYNPYTTTTVPNAGHI